MNKAEKGHYLYALHKAQHYANEHSTCQKVKVGSLIEVRTNYGELTVLGSNHGIGYSCIACGCMRKKLYGEDSKNHRLPSDCDAVHSEIDAIATAAEQGLRLADATIFITRYPCENCARAIALSGISRVVYGRKQEVSKYTESILSHALHKIELIHLEDFDEEDVIE